MQNKRVLVIFSGGQDSTTCLLKAIRDYGRHNIYAVTFVYGQRHNIEIACAKKICRLLHIPQKVIELNAIQDINHSALLDKQLDIMQNSEDQYPNTFVPGRNALFLLYAAVYAWQLDIRKIVIGVSEADYSGYPDCRTDFIASMQQSINLAMNTNFIIETPLIALTKQQVWALSDELGYLEFIQQYTHTCYLGIEGGCGSCPSCELRNNGLQAYLVTKKDS